MSQFLLCVCVCVYVRMHITYKHFFYSLLPNILLLQVPIPNASKMKTCHISLNVKSAFFEAFTFQVNINLQFVHIKTTTKFSDAELQECAPLLFI
jgi:hypothetical protein